MGLPVTIYRYTDAGAPQLTNGTPSEWMDILKKCLVSGYGTKAGLGWTMEFENAAAYKIAFRNKVADGGTGGYVQFWSATGTNAANTSINMQTAASMSALDTFTKPGYGRQLQHGIGYRGWEIIGTSRGFFITTYYTTNLFNGLPSNLQQYHQYYFIGDIESFTNNDTTAFALVSGISSSSDVFSSSSTGVNDSTLMYCRLYATDGSNSAYMYSASKIHGVSLPSADSNAESLGINHVMLKPMLTGDTNTQNNSVTMPFARGFVPGLHVSNFGGYKNENWPTELTRDGVKWVLLRSYYVTRLWIKTGTWYD